MKIHLTKKALVALCAAMGLSGCGSLDVPDLNNPSIETLRDTPTRATVSTAATGLIMGHRVGVAVQTGYIAELGVIGREAYIFDGSDPRPVTELLGPNLDPGGPAYGANFWTNPYANIRNANTLLGAVDKVAGVSDAEKEALRGFAKTLQALDFLVIINTRDTNGAVIDVNRPVGQLGEIVSKEAVFQHIATLLNEAEAHLKAGGNSFPFELSSGFSGFNTPATFLRFNRAVKARVDVYMGNHQSALDNLALSFISPAGSLDLGVYHTYDTGSGELANALNGKNINAHPSIETDADLQPDGKTLDDRVLRKTVVREKPATGGDGKLTATRQFKIYPNQNSSVPIIRNEELILLRAEANIGLGNLGPAIDDLNSIRVNSGKLAPRADLNADNILDELLKQKRYSLMFEGGHRWIDMRRYGKLQTLPKEYGNFPVHEKFPIPQQEMDARK
jgi:hypothetical protein